MTGHRASIKPQLHIARVLTLVEGWANGKPVTTSDAIWMASKLITLQRLAETPAQRRVWRNDMLCRLRMAIAPELDTYPAAVAVLERLKRYRRSAYERDRSAGGPPIGDQQRYLCFAICELGRVPKLRKLQDILAAGVAQWDLQFLG